MVSIFFGMMILLSFGGFSKNERIVITDSDYDDSYSVVNINEIKSRIFNKRKNKIVSAIIEVEKPTITCPAWISYQKERARGLLQQTPIFVKSCNEIIGYEKYRHSDSDDSLKAVEMFFVYQDYHNPNYDFERAAYLQNGGENYQSFSEKNKKKLRKYWNKVKIHL